MLLRWLNNLVFSLALALNPSIALADSFGQSPGFSIMDNVNRPVRIFGPACQLSSTDSTTYNSGDELTSFTITGVTDNMQVLIVMGVGNDDGATTFSVNSALIEGTAATELVDEDGSGLANSAIYRSATKITGAASVDISFTASEAVNSGGACVWAIENLYNIEPVATLANNNTGTAATVLSVTATQVINGGYILGYCYSAGSNTFTWTGLTERSDVGTVEANNSNADLLSTGAAVTIQCDPGANSDDESGVIATFR